MHGCLQRTTMQRRPSSALPFHELASLLSVDGGRRRAGSFVMRAPEIVNRFGGCVCVGRSRFVHAHASFPLSKKYMSSRPKVCIIGAGAAGLATARALVETTGAEVVIFEQRTSVGGIWNRDAAVKAHENPVSMMAWA